MEIFNAPDGTPLACHRTGDGNPLVVVPGGPMQAAAYLGDLGGLTARHPAVLLDLRGTGESAAPADPATYRCDRQVDDVEALRVHLGLERIDLAAHSAGAAIALQYAARFPGRIARLLLITPSPYVAGVEIFVADRRAVAEQRSGEPWFPDAFAALERLWSGGDADRSEIAPFIYGGRAAFGEELQNTTAAAAYYADGAVDPPAVREALAALDVPVLVIAGEWDLQLPPSRAAEYAALFPKGEMVVQPGAAHFPWLDDPAWFARTAGEWLNRR
ncbi:MAG: alpha/beta hydrolase [Actinoplanes sp.]